MKSLLEIYNTAFTFADILILIKAFTTVLILSVFYYHKEQSTTEAFQARYPNLYHAISAKKYHRAKIFFILVPLMHYYFVLLLIFHRYNTVSFLKTFAVADDEDFYDDYDLTLRQ